MELLPENVSSYGDGIDSIIHLIVVVVGIWFIAAEALLLFFAIRYRRKTGKPAAYVTGNTLTAAAWVLIPAAAVLACDLVIEAAGKPVWHEIKQTLPDPDQVVRIEGRQFVWDMVHPGADGEIGTRDDIATLNMLHVPLDATVQFELSAKDVIHSFFVPNMRLKQDAVPGRTIKGWFKATKEGEYMISCAELCGMGHGNMRGVLKVLGPEAYRLWVEENTPEDAKPAPSGETAALEPENAVERESPPPDR